MVAHCAKPAVEPICIKGEPLLTDERQKAPTRKGVVHQVKSWTTLFQPVVDGIKTHDIRILDRDYQVGDWLMMCEYDWGRKLYTGRVQMAEVTYITCARTGGDPRTQRACAFSPTCLHPDYGVLSIRKVPDGYHEGVTITEGKGEFPYRKDEPRSILDLGHG